MYVQCERCKTDYDFDDALVSERGTTVKCTSCGHQFKVYRVAASGQTGEDRWVVMLGDGRQLVFTSMKELQRAILAHKVGRNDTLARGGAPPRRLGSIAELEAFLDHRIAPDVVAQHTRTTRPPPPAMAIPPPVGAASGAPSERERRVESAPRARVETLRPDAYNGALPPPYEAAPTTVPRPAAELAALAAEEQAQDSVRTQVGVGPGAPPLLEPPPPVAVSVADEVTDVAPPVQLVEERRYEAPAAPAYRPAAPAAERRRAPSPAFPPSPDPDDRPPPRAVAASARAAAGVGPSSIPRAPLDHRDDRVTRAEGARATLPSYDDQDAPRGRLHSSIDEPMQGRPSRLGGWVLGFVLLAGTTAVALYVVRPDLRVLMHRNEGQAPLDPRAQQFLAAGEAALDRADLEAAKESFDKASALAEGDPKVLVDVARLAAVRADFPWLKQRLLAPDSPEIAPNKASLDDLAQRAKRAADDAVKAAPGDVAAERVQVDALRIAGDRDAARAAVRKLVANPSQADAAYVLAALDLGEIDPPWPVVIERLRTAATDDRGAGRSRVALVYALARSGDAAGARQELERMRSAFPRHALLAAAAAFVDRAASGQGAAGSPSGAPAASAPAPSSAPAGSASPGGGTPADPRQMIQLAEGAKARRDWPRAKALYNAALSRNGSDSEALAGLGDVAHSQHDLQSSLTFYKRAIAANPTFLPALTGRADVEWEMGDRAAAAKDYKEIVDRFPEGSYAARAKDRAGEAAPPQQQTPAPPPSAAPSAPSATPAPSSAAPPSDPPATGGTP